MNSKMIESEPNSVSKGLQEKLKDLLINAVKVEFEGKSQDHPVVVVNCLKNIISDDRESDHSNLLNSINNWLKTYPVYVDPDAIIAEVRKNATGEPVFVSDLAEAVQRGDKEEALSLGAKLHLSAQSPTLIQEAMTEIFLQDPDNYGPFCYHWLRANHFIASDKLIWPVSYSGFQFVGMTELPGPAYPSELPDFQSLLREYALKDDLNTLIILASLIRVLEHEYVRTPKFSHEVSYWMHIKMQDLDNVDSKELRVTDHQKIESDFYLKTLYSNLENVDLLPSLIKGLEAYRALIKIADSSTKPYIVQALQRWIKK